MKVLGVLQNQWFRNPEAVRRILARGEGSSDFRRLFLTRTLFLGCLTGRRLRQAFGEGWCRRIIWEEASPEIGGYAASVFPADRTHLAGVIKRVEPEIILAFGKIAQAGIEDLFPRHQIITAPHPAARGTETLAGLRSAADKLRDALEDFLARGAMP